MYFTFATGERCYYSAVDHEIVSQHKWHLQRKPHSNYAITSIRSGSTKKGWTTIGMHRLLLGLGPRQRVDHEDGDGLNNRRSNLRKASNGQNQHNRKKHAKKTSKFKGVSWCKLRRNWRVQLDYKGEVIRLGRFNIEREAALAYDIAAREKYGRFGRFNFPRKGEQGVD